MNKNVTIRSVHGRKTALNIKSIGLIGVGKMGVGIGKNLLENGFHVTAYDINPSNIDRLDAYGVGRAANQSEIINSSQAVITCLPTVDAVRTIYDGPSGLINSVSAGTYLIDCTSNDPVLTRELGDKAKAQGVGLIDAPILRGMEHAWAGTIQLVVGGDPEAIKDCGQIFDAIAEDLIYVGQLGNGHAVKSLNNQVTLINHVAICESFTVARKLGIDLETLHKVLDASQASSKKLNDLAPRLIQGDHEVTITIDAFSKDSRNFLKIADAVGASVEVAKAAFNVFGKAAARGLGDEAPTRIATMLADIAGTSFPGEAVPSQKKEDAK